MGPLSGTPWSEPRVVAGFTQTRPNTALLGLVEEERRRPAAPHVLDIGCGAGRNALPIARLGCHVLGLDLSRPMLEAARVLAGTAASPGRVDLALAPMDALPVATGAFTSAIDLCPTDPDLFVERARARLAQEKSGEAEQDIRAAMAAGRDDSFVHFSLGRAYEQGHQDAEAEAAHGQALAREDNPAFRQVRAHARLAATPMGRCRTWTW